MRIAKSFASFLAIVFFGAWAHAVPPSFTYQGQLTDTSDHAITSMTTVYFTILDPTGSCVLYQEYASVTPNSDGFFSYQVGTGSAGTLQPALTSLAKAFNNTLGFVVPSKDPGSCSTGFTISSGDEKRLLRISVGTYGSGDLSPDIEITSVPFATQAGNAEKLAGLSYTRYLRSSSVTNAPDFDQQGLDNISFIASPSSCTSSQVLAFDSSGAAQWKCTTLPADATGITSLNGINSLTQNFANGTAGTAPAFVSSSGTHTLNIPMASGAGVTSGTINKTEYDSFSSKLGSGTAFGGDVSGTYDNLVLASVGTGGTYFKVTTDTKGRVISGVTSLADSDLPLLPWSKITSTPTTLAGYGIADAIRNGGQTGAVSAGTTDTNSLTLKTNNTDRVVIGSDGKVGVGTSSADAVLHVIGPGGGTLKIVDGTQGAGKILTSDANGVASWASVPVTAAVTSVATGAGLTGGTITSTGTISLANIADATMLANVSGSAAAPTETTLSALIDKASNVQGSILYRNATSWVALAPGTAGYFLKTGGASANPSWADSATSITLAGDVSGAVGSNTVDKIKNVPVSATAPTTTGQVLRYNSSTTKWEPAFLSMFDLRSTVTGTTAFGGVGCLANQTITWTSAIDNLACADISLPAAQVTGNLPASQISGTLPVANGGTGVTSLPSTFVLNGGQSGALVAGTSDANSLTLKTNASARLTILSSGNVGVGIASPNSLLTVNGVMALAETSAPSATSGFGKVYVKSADHTLYYRDATGTESNLLAPTAVAGASTGAYVINSNSDGSGNDGGVNFRSNGADIVTLGDSGDMALLSTTASSSATTGALTVSGGVGVAGSIYSGGSIKGAAIGVNTVTAPQIYGSAAASGSIKIDGTSDATKGAVLLNSTGGNVGVGITNPTGLLQLVKSSNPEIKISTSTASMGRIGISGPLAGQIASGTLAGSLVLAHDSGAIHLATAASSPSVTRMTIATDGKVGIGVTSPQVALDVNGETRSTVKIVSAAYASTPISWAGGSYAVPSGIPTATLAGLLAGDLVLVEANCAMYVSSGLIFMTIQVVGSGTWDLTPNEAVVGSSNATTVHSMGLFRATASGNADFKMVMRVDTTGGFINHCNLIARVIGR